MQGVFFRATSLEFSRNHDVVGYVRNRPDGSVELEAEGAADAVRVFLNQVETHFARNIRERRETRLDPRGDETTFQIR